MQTSVRRITSWQSVLVTLFLLPFLLSGIVGFVYGRTEHWLADAGIAGLAVMTLSVLHAFRGRPVDDEETKRFYWDTAVAAAQVRGWAVFMGFSAGVIWFH